MTNDLIDQVSRNFIGHLATNADVRNAVLATFNAKGDVNAAMAVIINGTVGPETPVKPEDVPKITVHINRLFGTDEKEASTSPVCGAYSFPPRPTSP